ncbi:type II toxin-antitoxin system HipA family toxin [Corynebacterium sp. AOP40-9SA-29]|uniref:type II toxin-antitoxin system HipA family toxin n=1 Tax=Corynebacterium sp. AOP40-9SA-29 TaxID=3457677 RepID=UPI0040342C69
MNSASSDDTLIVVTNGQVIGDIQRTGSKKMRLRYTSEGDPSFTPLSVTMPGPRGRYREALLGPWLDGLLPDRPEALRQWRRRFGMEGDTSTFGLLRHVGEDVAGAAQFIRPKRLDEVLARTGELESLDEAGIADMARRAMADLPVTAELGPDGKFSLAGAQAKIALHRDHGRWSNPHGATPSTHILKPAIPGMQDQDLVEAVTLGTAQRLGLRTAAAEVSEFDGLRCLVVERYDRFRNEDGNWSRVHQEDMCQATGTPPFRKYESQLGPGARQVADLISSVSNDPQVDNRRFAQALIFNWLVCGTDAHARNYSIILREGSVRLAPLYDINSHLAYMPGSSSDLSMSVDGIFRASLVSRGRWIAEAARLHVPAGWMADEIDRQSDVVVESMRAAAEVPNIAQYASPVIAGMIEATEGWVTRLAGG